MPLRKKGKEPNYEIMFEEFMNRIMSHLRVMHKEAYPSYAQPGHSRWKQAILEKLGPGLTMKERYDELNDLFSGLIRHNYMLRDADSSETFQELLGI